MIAAGAEAMDAGDMVITAGLIFSVETGRTSAVVGLIFGGAIEVLGAGEVAVGIAIYQGAIGGPAGAQTTGANGGGGSK